MRLWTTFDYVRHGWTPAKNASLSTTVSENSNLGALRTGLAPEKGTKAIPRIRGARLVPRVASTWKRTWKRGDRCGQKGHLKKACPNPKKMKSGKDAATTEKDLDQSKRWISSTMVDHGSIIVNDQPRARIADVDGVMSFATTEHRTYNVVCTTCKKRHHTAAECQEGNKDRRPANYRAKAARVRWEDQHHGEAEQAAKDAKDNYYRRYTGADQGPSKQGDTNDHAPRLTYMAHTRAFYQTLLG